MILSLLLLGVLEYLWLHNEYNNKYRDMEDKLSHVMFSAMRDVEDSLIFSKISPQHLVTRHPHDVNFKIDVHAHDSAGGMKPLNFRATGKHGFRGVLLEKLSRDSTAFDTTITMGALVMRNIKQDDSTGEWAGYELISWQQGDTSIDGMMSRPQFDILGNQKIALSHTDYRADIFHELLPHLSFAVFLWIIVGAAFFYTWRNLTKQIQLNSLRDEFVSNITHELKTPITSVGIALESLKLTDEVHSPQSKRYLDISQNELKRLSLLVDRILHNHVPDIAYEKIDIRQVLDEVMGHMKVLFDNKHANIEIKTEGDGFLIKGDRAHISSVLYNLIENALKYSKTKPEIRIRLQQHNGSVRMDISDNGIGIAKDYHEKIFEKLFRVPNHNLHDVKGHGLGLSYVAEVVQKHHGRIELTSEPGKGATFSINLPAWHEN